MTKRHWLRAIGVGVVVFVTALSAYQRPPEDIALYWQPALQAILAGITQLGVNGVTRTPRG